MVIACDLSSKHLAFFMGTWNVNNIWQRKKRKKDFTKLKTGYKYVLETKTTLLVGRLSFCSQASFLSMQQNKSYLRNYLFCQHLCKFYVILNFGGRV